MEKERGGGEGKPKQLPALRRACLANCVFEHYIKNITKEEINI